MNGLEKFLEASERFRKILKEKKLKISDFREDEELKVIYFENDEE